MKRGDIVRVRRYWHLGELTGEIGLVVGVSEGSPNGILRGDVQILFSKYNKVSSIALTQGFKPFEVICDAS